MNSFNPDELKDGLKSSIKSQDQDVKEDNPDAIKEKRNRLDFGIETVVKCALTFIIGLISLAFTVFVIAYMVYLWFPESEKIKDAKIDEIKHIIYLVMQFMFISLISVFVNKYLNRK